MNNLSALRAKAGLTQQALADKVGCNRQQIYKFEAGECPVPLKHAKALAKALNVPEGQMLDLLTNIKLQWWGGKK